MQRPLFSHVINNFDGPRFRSSSSRYHLGLQLDEPAATYCRQLLAPILLDQVLIAVLETTMDAVAVSFAKLYSSPNAQRNQRLLIHSTNTVCRSSIHPPIHARRRPSIQTTIHEDIKFKSRQRWRTRKINNRETTLFPKSQSIVAYPPSGLLPRGG